MAEDATKRRLGRGLAALIGEASPESVALEGARAPRRLPIEFLEPNSRNPRHIFDEEELENLVASVKEKGILQPILVRPHPDREGRDQYEIIAGERRWRAAARAGLSDVPVVIQNASDQETLEIAIIENVQRSDLNPLEEAQGYQQLISEFGYSQNILGDIIGKSRSHVANTLRLLKLKEEVKGYLREGLISAGHARALIGRDDAEALADLIVRDELSVRDTEKLIAYGEEEDQYDQPAKPSRKQKKNADTVALEKAISESLGLLIDIRHKDNGSGEVRLKYKTLEQLDDITQRLKNRP